MLAIAMLVTSVAIALDLAALTRVPLPAAATDTVDSAEANHEPLPRAFSDAANALLAGEHAPLLATGSSPRRWQPTPLPVLPCTVMPGSAAIWKARVGTERYRSRWCR